MAWQILSASKAGTLSLKNNQCFYYMEEDGQSVSFPLDNISVIVIESRHINITTALLSAAATNNIVIFICGEAHLPCGVFYPYLQHFAYSKIAHLQKDWSEPFKNRLWQNIVIAKITNQSKVLSFSGKEGAQKLIAIARAVESGDCKNAEGYAASLYWRYLWGAAFIRGNNDNINAALNYGYAIMRGIVARAVVATGFIPCFGVHHCNQLNQFNLVDDIMEPFRPLVDLHIFKLFKDGDIPDGLAPKTKQDILRILLDNMFFEGKHIGVLSAAEAACRTLSLATQNKDYRLFKTPSLCM